MMPTLERNQTQAVALREAADAAEDAQRAAYHLSATLEAWSEMTDAERLVSVRDALDRLTGAWRERTWPGD